MKAAGINAATPNPPKGVIQRAPDGSLNGLFFEDAMQLFNRVLPDPSYNFV